MLHQLHTTCFSKFIHSKTSEKISSKHRESSALSLEKIKFGQISTFFRGPHLQSKVLTKKLISLTMNIIHSANVNLKNKINETKIYSKSNILVLQ